MHRITDHQATTLDGELSSAGKCTWVAYLLIVFLSSVVGDTIILVAAKKYRAFQLHEFLVTIIQHIAVCDLLLCSRTALFRLVPIIAEEWILGDIPCYINTYGSMYLFTASFLLVCILTTSKLILLRDPLRSSSLTKEKANLFCALAWICSIFPLIGWMIIDKDDIYLDRRVLLCRYRFSSDIWANFWLLKVGCIFPRGLVLVVVYTSIHSVIILSRAKRAGEKRGEHIQWGGVTTVVLTGIIFLISMLPSILMHMALKLGEKGDNQELYNPDLYLCTRITSALIQLHIMSNFYVYCLTVPSFRKFIKARIKSFSSKPHRGTFYS